MKVTTETEASKVHNQSWLNEGLWLCGMGIYPVLGFPSLYIDQVRESTTTTKFSVVLNGNLVGYFGSKKGKRQGD